MTCWCWLKMSLTRQAIVSLSIGSVLISFMVWLSTIRIFIKEWAAEDGGLSLVGYLRVHQRHDGASPGIIARVAACSSDSAAEKQASLCIVENSLAGGLCME